MSGIPETFTIRQLHPGIIQPLGKSAGIESNWYYDVTDPEQKECIAMFCRPNGYTILDKNMLQHIREINGRLVTWFIMENGYIAGHIMTGAGTRNIYLHQVLMNHHGHGVGNDSIDHINRNKLDNRIANLRITSPSEQNSNRGKMARKQIAKPLPNGIVQSDLPKFVIYYNEKHGNGTREFFTIEKHPLQNQKEAGIQDAKTEQLINKRWATSKSKSMTIQEKLQQARNYIAFLDRLMSENE